MKPRRAYFHTFRLPSLRRLLLPVALLCLFSTAVWIGMNHRPHGSAPALHTSVASTPVENTSFVMIDPGHGGYDPGVKLDSLTEANLTLKLAKQLQSELQKRGVRSALTRETDIDYTPKGLRGRAAKRADLNHRIELANEQHATLFISLHLNKSSVATRGGSEVFYYEQTPGAKELAEKIQNALHQLPNMSKRDAKAADYYLLRNQKIPALIIECGYLNIPAERARLTNADYQQKLMAAIAQSVADSIKSGQTSGQTNSQK